jgi:hypothetical protein
MKHDSERTLSGLECDYLKENLKKVAGCIDESQK